MTKKLVTVFQILLFVVAGSVWANEEPADPGLTDRIADRLVAAVQEPQIEYVAFTKSEVRQLATDTENWSVETDENNVEWTVLRDDLGEELYREKLDDLINSLNQMEQPLNQIGVSLRSDDELGGLEKVWEYFTDPDQFKDQAINAFAIPLRDEAIATAREYLNETEIEQCPQLDPEDVYAHIDDLTADTEVELSTGDKMKADEYIDYMNDSVKVMCIIAAPFLYEGSLFPWDINLPSPNWPAGLGKNEFVSEMNRLLLTALSALDIDPIGFIPESFLSNELYHAALARIQSVTERILSNAAEALLWALAKAAQNVPSDLKIPQIPSNPAVEPNPQFDLELKKRKDWKGFDIGDHDIVGAEAFAYYELRGNDKAQAAEIYGKAVGYVLSRELNIVSGRADYRVDAKQVNASLEFKTLAKDLVSFNSQNALEYSVNSKEIADSDHPFRATIKKSHKHKFYVGPVPINVEIGVDGFTKLDYEVVLNPVNVYGGITPATGVDGFADGSAGFKGLLAAGVEANLTFIDFSAPMSGTSELSFDDFGRPSLSMDIIGSTKVNALDGKIDAYAEYVVPRWGLPPWKKKKKRSTIFGWRGLDYSKRIFNWGITYGQYGVSMRGNLLDQTDIAHEEALRSAILLSERHELLTSYSNTVNERVHRIVVGVESEIASDRGASVHSIVGTLETDNVDPVVAILANLETDISGTSVSVREELTRDTDGDGLTDLFEGSIGTNSDSSDSDGDGIDDHFEHIHDFLNPLDSADAETDFDEDGFTNLAEYLVGSDLSNPEVTPDTIHMVSWLIPVIGLILH